MEIKQKCGVAREIVDICMIQALKFRQCLTINYKEARVIVEYNSGKERSDDETTTIVSVYRSNEVLQYVPSTLCDSLRYRPHSPYPGLLSLQHRFHTISARFSS